MLAAIHLTIRNVIEREYLNVVAVDQLSDGCIGDLWIKSRSFGRRFEGVGNAKVSYELGGGELPVSQSG